MASRPGSPTAPTSQVRLTEHPHVTDVPRPLLALTLAVALLVAAPLSAQKMPAPIPREGSRIGDLAFDFTLKDLDGKPYRLKDMRGRQVVHIVFWATWCMPCIEEVPTLRETYARYHDQGLEILGVVVPMNQTRGGVRAFADKFKMSYPLLWDDNMALMNRYRVDSIPQNFLIGRDGIIRYAGTALPAAYEELIQKALAQDAGSRAAAR